MSNFIIIPVKIHNCKECPFYNYAGSDWSEDIFVCEELEVEVSENGIDHRCPYLNE